jgi:hypothetical protein
MLVLNQAGGDIFGTLVWFAVFFIFIVLYPRLMLSQLIWQIEAAARKLEAMSDKANSIAARKAGDRSAKKAIDEFTDFFVIEPSALDPFGIVKKIDQVIRQTEHRFDEFVDSIAGKKDAKEKQELNYGLRAAIGLRQLAKIVRHYVEIAKKFKNLQVAMLVRMQMPIIEKLADSEFKGTQAFVNGWPIGDSIGPLVAASMLDRSGRIAEDVVAGTVTIEGRKCIVMKAKGPEPSLGRVDEAIEAVMKKYNISRVITVDAAQKLEGEKTGSVAEGVGFAMGGFAMREIIENSLLPHRKPIDGIAIKVGMEEALYPMRKEIWEALPKAMEAVRKAVRRARKGQAVLIIGVGNSCGIPDTKRGLDKVKELVYRVDARMREEEEKEKKGSWI